jgi:PKD repeat protein
VASAAPASATPEESITFSATGSDVDGDALTYAWDFGDGNVSSEQNPVHAFADVGTHTATVTVTDPAGATGSATVIVTISKSPTARLTTSDVVGFGSLPLTFDASFSTDPENSIASYTWDFGDGTPVGHTQIISKIYDEPGTYTVTLTVTDDVGITSTLQRIVEVLPADQAGLFNGYVDYKVRWNRDADSADTLSLAAQVNVGDLVVAAGTSVALDVAGQHFEGTLDTKLRDYSDSNVKWQVKANVRGQPFGTVLLKAKIKHADLGLGFNQAGAVTSADPHDTVTVDIPVQVTIGGNAFEVPVSSDFTFSSDGKKGRGEGAQ